MSIAPPARPPLTLLPAVTPVRTMTALPTDPRRRTGETVRLYNASGVTLRIATYRRPGRRDVRPAIGTTVAPGGTVRLGVVAQPVSYRPEDGRSGTFPDSPAAGPHAVVVAVAVEAMLPDGAAGGRRYLLGATEGAFGDMTDRRDGALESGPIVLSVTDVLALRTAGGYVVVEDRRRIRGDHHPDAPAARSRTPRMSTRWRVNPGQWSGA